MPVVSPSRYPSTSTSSALSSGSFRSSLTSSTSSGTYIRSSYGDKTTEYRSHYSDVDGKRERKSSLVEYTRSSRAPSITDSDSGISTRYRSERSESRSRDISTSKSDCGKSPAVLSPAEFYKKYSPANYVPKTQRLAQAEIARSKSISGVIGRPPAPEATRPTRKSRISSVISERLESRNQLFSEGTPTSIYAKRGEKEETDSNGNEVPSVAETRKRYDPKMAVTKLPSKIPSRRISSRGDVPVHYSNGKSDDNDDWDFSELRFSSSKAMSEPISFAKPNGDQNAMSNSFNGKSISERLASIKSLIDPNNPIGKILEKSTVIQVGNGESDNERKCCNGASSDTVKDKSELEINNDTNELVNKKKNTIRYIDCEADGGLDYDVSPSDTGFENKTFEHENYLMKRSEEDRRMDTSTESFGSDLTDDSSPEYPAVRRKLFFDEELAGGKSGPSGLRRSNERYDRYSNDDGPHYNGLNGLRNIGNTCFMNSVLQCLSNTRPLLEYVSEDQYMSEINTTLSCMRGALIKAFGSVIKELWRPGERDTGINTTSFKSQVQRFAPRFMGYSQQDAQEFLRYLLEGLHEDVNRVTLKPKPILTEIDDNLSDSAKASEAWSRYLRMEDSRIGDIFMGQLKSTLRCTHCQHDSVTFDPFWDLSLPIPSRTGNHKLQQCLQLFTREEELDGDEKPTCSKCGVRRKCLKWFTVQKFPQVLVLHLKRFSPTERFRGKLSVHIEFPLNGLDMSPYAANKGQEATYNLYAVSNHSGTTYSGHYTAYCKHPYGGEWHEYNDSRVSSISSRNVVSAEAYVLFYELAKPKTT